MTGVTRRFADEAVVRGAYLTTPDLANPSGNVHGGHVVRLADNLAYACASRFAGRLAVTAALDRVDFHAPVYVGELLSMVARIEFVGRTSMEVSVEVHAEELATGAVRHTNSCYLTFVALENGRPAPVPRLVCRTREDKIRYLIARRRSEMGKRYRDDRKTMRSSFDNLSDGELDSLMDDTG